MLKNINLDIKKLGIYILNDQPTACGICGARTDFEDVDDMAQLHQCLNSECGYIFITEEDEECTMM